MRSSKETKQINRNVPYYIGKKIDKKVSLYIDRCARYGAPNHEIKESAGW